MDEIGPASGNGSAARSRYEDSIVRSLRRMSRALDLQSRALKRSEGITAPQLICLLTLAREGPMNPSALSRAVSLSQATVTGIVDRLAARGLVNRRRDTEDRRVVVVDVTDDGNARAGSAPSVLNPDFSEQLSALPDGEQAMLDWALRRIVEMMEGDSNAAESPNGVSDGATG